MAESNTGKRYAMISTPFIIKFEKTESLSKSGLYCLDTVLEEKKDVLGIWWAHLKARNTD